MALINVNSFDGEKHQLMPIAVGHVEAARLIGVSERKLHTMVKNREVVPSRLGGRRLYLVDDLKRLLEERRG